MKVEQNKMISLSYTLTSEEGLIESVTAEKPMEFIYGVGYLLPSFEEKIQDKQIGDKFDFTLTPEEAYGEHDKDRILELDAAMFKGEDGKIDSRIQIGYEVPMQDVDGNRLMGTVLVMDENNVTMDFNHPMAGSTLHFVGEVVGVRELTPEDLAGNNNGCGCGGCGDGGCGDNDCADEGCGDNCGCGHSHEQ